MFAAEAMSRMRAWWKPFSRITRHAASKMTATLSFLAFAAGWVGCMAGKYQLLIDLSISFLIRRNHLLALGIEAGEPILLTRGESHQSCRRRYRGNGNPA